MERWQPRTCAESLAAAASRWPEKRAILIEGRSRTFRELWADVRRTAANLKRLGLRRGDHLRFALAILHEWATLLFAAATIGAVTVPVNTRFKADELLYCLRQADVRMLAIADRFLKIDFIAMLAQHLPRARSGNCPIPSCRCSARVIVFGDDVPAGALPASELNRAGEQRPDEHSEGSHAR